MVLEAIYTILYIILAIVFIVVGIYLILLLHETRKSLSRFNQMVGHLNSITRFFDRKVASPANSIASVVKVFNDFADIVKEFKGGKRRKSDE